MKIYEKLQSINAAWTKERIITKAKCGARFLLNSRLQVCLFIAWMITDGWSCILFAIGMFLKIKWMRMVSGAYMGLLWLPFTPEKIFTLLLAILLLCLLSPHDRHTLGVLKAKLRRLRKNRAPQSE